MATTVITNTIKDLNGTAMQGVEVVVELIPSRAYKLDTAQELATREVTFTDASGIWTMTLEESLNITPGGSYYRATERVPREAGGKRVWYFLVPAGDSSLYANLLSEFPSSGFIAPFICTSSTRPGAPFVGQMIFETDTGKVLYYYGTTLSWKPNWGQAWGEIAYVEITSGMSTGSTSYVDITSLTIAFTAILGRRYVAELSADCQLTVASSAINIAIADGASVVLNERQQNYNSAAWTSPCPITHRSSGIESGSVTRKGRINVGSGGGTGAILASATKKPLIIVRDVGPAANPVIT